MTLEERIGAQLIFGIPGTTVTPEIIQHFKDTHAGGLILYRINFESPEQTRKLIGDLETALGRSLLVCVDHEGGRVVMFGEGVTIFPSAQAFGQTGNTQFVRHQGEQEARELRRLGVDVNFAPVVDVLTETYSSNIGIRAYGKDPDLVAKMGAARVSALQVENVSAVAKHFPGLGAASLDPHLNLPTIDMTWEDWDKVHGIPFLRAMRTAVQGIMTSHPLYPKLDPTPRTPATFSRVIVYDNLRHRIGYKGVIFSDDLEMGALKDICSVGEAAVRAAAAGHDALLVCHDLIAQRQSYDALLEAHKSGRLSEKELDDSVKRIESLKSRRTERFAPLPATALRAEKEASEVRTLVQQICDASVTILKNGQGLMPAQSTAVIFPSLSEMAPNVLVEPALMNEKAFLKERLNGFGISQPTIQLVGLEATAADITASAALAGMSDQTILFVFDAHLHAGTKALLEQVQASAKRLVIVLLRDVYDVEFVRDQTLCLTNYGFRVCDLEAVLRKMFIAAPVA
jgi:beta-N-acetylhexosaminidase